MIKDVQRYHEGILLVVSVYQLQRPYTLQGVAGGTAQSGQVGGDMKVDFKSTRSAFIHLWLSNLLPP